MPLRNIPGHRRILSLLARSIGRDALPPSLLFAGQSDSPAHATAIAVAQLLNCQSRLTADDSRLTTDDSRLTTEDSRLTTDDRRLTTDSCGVCSACDRIARGIHPDVQVVQPADTGLIRIDPIRDAIERSA